MKQYLLQVGLIFLLSLLLISSVFAEDLTVIADSDIMAGKDHELSFSWIEFMLAGEVIAKVNEKCEIVIWTKKKIGIHINAELERYKNMCIDMQTIKNEGR